MLARDKVEKEYKNMLPSLGLTIWSPLKFGILTGKYNSGVPQDSRATKNQNLQVLLNSVGKCILCNFYANL
jgi:aryl-alcohol dehydrogenase-like predicted oxidoreductase